MKRTQNSRRILFLIIAIIALFSAHSSQAQTRPVQLPLSRTSSSIKFGVNSPSPTLQMNGSFTKFGGQLYLDTNDFTKSKVDLSLDLRSAQLLPDQILQAVFLQTAVAHLKQPETSFVSERIESLKGKTYLVHGIYKWQGKQRRTTVPVEIIQLSPFRSEIRVNLAGQAKPGEEPQELQQLAGISAAGSKGWAKGTFVFATKG